MKLEPPRPPVQRVIYKMECVSGVMTPEEASKAARKMLAPYAGGRHDV